MRSREQTMRGELVNGLAGARKIQAQLKEGKQREQELRATNSILQAKVFIHEVGRKHGLVITTLPASWEPISVNSKHLKPTLGGWFSKAGAFMCIICFGKMSMCVFFVFVDFVDRSPPARFSVYCL